MLAMRAAGSSHVVRTRSRHAVSIFKAESECNLNMATAVCVGVLGKCIVRSEGE